MKMPRMFLGTSLVRSSFETNASAPKTRMWETDGRTPCHASNGDLPLIMCLAVRLRQYTAMWSDSS
jgi:hypothetical protein